MTKFAFQFPAKIILAESNLVPRKVDCKYDLYSFDNLNVYFCTKKHKVVSQKQEYNIYFLLIAGHLVYVSCRENDQSMIDFMDSTGDRLNGYIEQYTNWILNPVKYEEDQATKREKVKQEREESDREENERKEKRMIAAEQAFQYNLEKFRNGEYVTWETFEEGCKLHGLKIPIKTIGWGRKYIKSVSLGSYSTIGKTKSTVLYSYIDGLKKKLDGIN